MAVGVETPGRGVIKSPVIPDFQQEARRDLVQRGRVLLVGAGRDAIAIKQPIERMRPDIQNTPAKRLRFLLLVGLAAGGNEHVHFVRLILLRGGRCHRVFRRRRKHLLRSGRGKKQNDQQCGNKGRPQWRQKDKWLVDGIRFHKFWRPTSRTVKQEKFIRSSTDNLCRKAFVVGSIGSESAITPVALFQDNPQDNLV